MPTARSLPALLAATLSFPMPVAAAAGPWHDDGPARVRLISPWEAAPAAGELRLGLEIALAPGWHVYWRNSGDAGYPPSVDLAATPGLGPVELLFPVPERYDLPGDLVAFGYEEEVVYPLRATADFGAASSIAIRGTVDYVVCASECVPFTSPLALDQPLAAAPRAAPAEASRLAAFEARLARPLPATAALSLRTLERSQAGGAFELLATGLPDPPGDLFFAPHDLVDLGRPARREMAAGTAFAVPFTWRDRGRTPEALDLAWTLAVGPGGFAGDATLRLGAAPSDASPGAGVPPATPPAWPWLALAGVALLGIAWAVWPRSEERRAA